MKTCIKCEQTKPISEFHKKGKGHKPLCRDCSNKRARERYHKNKKFKTRRVERVAANVKTRITRLRAKVNKVKSVPCADCGRTWPAVAMDLHHREPEEKIATISAMINKGLSWKKIETEIAKCIVLCACCHRLRTYGSSSGEEQGPDESRGGGSNPPSRTKETE